MTDKTKTRLDLSSPSLIWAFLPQCILLVPAIAMQFTDAVDWSAGDFAVASLLLIVAGLGGILIARHKGRFSPALFLGVLIIVGTVFAWAELAVGVL